MRSAIVAVAVTLLPATALAQFDDEDRFFAPDDSGADKTSYDGSLTLTTFGYRETGGVADPLPGGTVGIESASSQNGTLGFDRTFADLRIQLDADHISGGKFSFHSDLRGRVSPTCTRNEPDGDTEEIVPCANTQSGTFGGDELEAREFYLERKGKKTDFSLGRQFALEVAAIKFDGAKIVNRKSREWSYIVFGGTYPTRGSRDVRDDYPKKLPDPAAPMEATGRVYPLVAGAAAAYRLDRLFGSFGAGAIFPLANESQDAAGGAPVLEDPRVFLTANGYWRQSPKLDVFHYMVFDVASSTGRSLTNLSGGLNFRPVPLMRAYVQVHHVDTETLNISVQDRLEDVDPQNLGIQNNIYVSRIAQESARGGLSVAFYQNRFEVSTAVAYRRRPEVNIGKPGMEVTFPKAEAVDVSFRFLDRHSFKDLRIGLTGTRSFGIGETTLERNESLVVRGDVASDFKQGLGEIEGNISYVASKDVNRDALCADPLTCFGTSSVSTIGLGVLAFYRFKPQWFAMGSLNVATQSLTSQVAMAEISQPGLFMTTVFGRIAYRF